MLATQPSAMPTNKALTMLGGFVTVSPFVGPFVQEVWPQIAPSFLAGPASTEAMSALLAGLVSLIVAWFVPDRLNQIP